MTAGRPPGSSSYLDPASFRLLISRVLVGGVSTSAILVAIGLVTGLLFGWDRSLAGSSANAGNASDFSRLLDNLAAVRPIGIAQLGLLVLLATPVLRVAAALVGFALERDRLYVLVSGVVLCVLLASLFLLR
ncbi:MAG TPA: DUF1634 domain-containing protein [Candidatus Saccharimonadales bacterium]|nr:DUF1634 domain-containing protein [Candidatus Saccharimonadales bacterium]